MKYIAVIGCSFTAHDYIRLHYADSRDSTEWNSWSQYIPEDYPNVEVHNYAYSAMAVNYFEILLKQLAHFKHYKYDAVIIQLSSDTRWGLPLDTPVENYVRYNDFWKAKDPEFKVDDDPFAHPLIIEHEIPTNIDRYKHMLDLSSVITFGGVNRGIPTITGIRHSQPVDKDKLEYINSLVQGGLPLTSLYMHSFLKTIPMYEKYFSKVFYWQPRGGLNNIGHDVGGFDMMEKNTTDFLKYTRADKGDPGHLSKMGNKMLYQLYIKHSAIGDWLNDQ